ncbi:MAG: SCP2 sterol-binding domain-containing protein [Methylococcales bacterium]
MLIKPLLFNVLEIAINRYLALGGNVAAVLAPLAGKVIAITVLPFNETLYLCPSQSGIQLLDQYTLQPDTTLTGSAVAFGRMGLSATPMRAIFQGEVTITGDTQVGHHFQRLFSKLDINLEAHLAKVTGEGIAHQVGQFFRAAQLWGSDSLQTLKLNTSELLQEETRDLPAPAEAEMVYQQIDVLRNDYDRLQARLLRLQDSLQNQS